MKLTRRNLATLLTATAAAAQAAPQTPAPQAPSEPDDMTAARSALRASLDTLAKTNIPIAVEPAAHFKA